MIIHTEIAEQVIDRDRTDTFVKEVVRTRGAHVLGMVRKRRAPLEGTRGAVLLVHGFAQNRYSWHLPRRSFACFLAAQGWDVFNADLRGHGRSGRFGSLRASALREHIHEDLPALVEEVVRLSGHERVVLIGHSMGGLVAYSAASTELTPRLRALVSIGTPYRWGLGSRTMTAAGLLLDGVRGRGIVRPDRPVRLRRFGAQLRRQRLLWDLRLLPIPVRAWLPGSIERDILDDYLGRAFDVTSVQIAFDLVRWGEQAALDGCGYASRFEAMDVPLLVVAGTHDSLAPVASVRPAFERSRSTDKSFRAFPLGHIDLIVGRQAPRTVWPAIAAWLARR